MTDLRIDLSPRECNIILDALFRECMNTKRRKWRASEQIMHIQEVERIRGKIVSAELQSKHTI